MNFKSIILIGLVFFFGFNSCKTLKNRRINNKETLTLEQVYDSVLNYQMDYNTISGKFTVKYKNKSKTMSLKGSLRIIKDSVIWLSLTPGLGIEVARLKCTKDSIYLLDKLNKSLTKGKYEYIKRLWKVDVDYNSIQSILTNQFFVYPIVNSQKSDFTEQFTLKKDSINIVTHRKTDESVENVIKFDKKGYYIMNYLVNDIKNIRSMNIKYAKGNFEGLSNFPQKVDVLSSNSGKSLAILVNYTRVTKNSNVKIPFKVPSSYRVIVH